jgi:hypothetical protein
MVNVLDVLETIKYSSITPKKTVETSEVSTEAFGAEASKQQFDTEAGPSEPTKVKPFETEETNIAEAAEKKKYQSQFWLKKPTLMPPKLLQKCMIILCDTLRERNYLKKRFLKLITMPEN